ncbi:DUF6776 family protein [Marilutibacter chinensis]|uniref:Transmembrane protein n=1 Tax=Marilutibacter chinensis TaxID=2912247 RepID=A0ABS9HYT1_9GAMM|nr:DUF6776 family protein [Lysobacter chinensis]MCF7223309.1 hypothetical protein [Lysobacter chinensis]
MSPSPRNTPPPRYRIVQQGPDRRPLIWTLLVLAWLGSVAVAWRWSQQLAAPRLPELSRELTEARGRLKRQQGELETLRQRTEILEKSDQITRAANKQVQRSLAEREEEIAGLREDVAFYERLVGATTPRKGLNVHSSQFTREAAGSWRYEIVLTQNLNRGAVSEGRLKFAIEGVREGKLAAIDWDALHQTSGAPGQPYSFRYFQQLAGSVMLPQGFTPQRVKVRLRGESGSVDQTLAWQGREPENATAATAVAGATGANDLIQGEP